MLPSFLAPCASCHCTCPGVVFTHIYEIDSLIFLFPPLSLSLSNSTLHGTETMMFFVPTNVSAPLSMPREHYRQQIYVK